MPRCILFFSRLFHSRVLSLTTSSVWFSPVYFWNSNSSHRFMFKRGGELERYPESVNVFPLALFEPLFGPHGGHGLLDSNIFLIACINFTSCRKFPSSQTLRLKFMKQCSSSS